MGPASVIYPTPRPFLHMTVTMTMTMTIPLRASRASLDLPIHLPHPLSTCSSPSTSVPTMRPMLCATPVCRWFGLSVIYFNFLFFYLSGFWFSPKLWSHVTSIAPQWARPMPVTPLFLVPLCFYPLASTSSTRPPTADHPNLGRRARTMGPRSGRALGQRIPTPPPT